MHDLFFILELGFDLELALLATQWQIDIEAQGSPIFNIFQR